MNTIELKINEIDNEEDIISKYSKIIKLHKIIDDEEEKLDKLNEKINRNVKSKYDNMDLEKIVSKFEKTDNIEKRIKYYHSISNKINDIINTINN